MKARGLLDIIPAPGFCQYCQEGKAIYRYSSSSSDVEIRVVGSHLNFNDDRFIHSKNINFCPMCGRKL